MEAEMAMPGTASGISLRTDANAATNPEASAMMRSTKRGDTRASTWELVSISAATGITAVSAADTKTTRHMPATVISSARMAASGRPRAVASAVPNMGDMSGATSIAPMMVVAESAATPAVAITVAASSRSANEEY